MSGKHNRPSSSSQGDYSEGALNQSNAALNALAAAYVANTTRVPGFYLSMFPYSNAAPFGVAGSSVSATQTSGGFPFWPPTANDYLLSMAAAANLRNLQSPPATSLTSPTSAEQSFSPAKNKPATSSSVLNGNAEAKDSHVTESFEEILRKMARPPASSAAPSNSNNSNTEETLDSSSDANTSSNSASTNASSRATKSGLATLAQVASCIKAVTNSGPSSAAASADRSSRGRRLVDGPTDGKTLLVDRDEKSTNEKPISEKSIIEKPTNQKPIIEKLTNEKSIIEKPTNEKSALKPDKAATLAPPLKRPNEGVKGKNNNVGVKLMMPTTTTTTTPAKTNGASGVSHVKSQADHAYGHAVESESYSMDSNRLNAAAMAWSALSNRLLLAASLQHQHQLLLKQQQELRQKQNEKRISEKLENIQSSAEVILDCASGISCRVNDVEHPSTSSYQLGSQSSRRGRPLGTGKRPSLTQSLAKIEKNNKLLQRGIQVKQAKATDNTPALDLSIRSAAIALPSFEKSSPPADHNNYSLARKRLVQSGVATSSNDVVGRISNRRSSRTVSSEMDQATLTDGDHPKAATTAPSADEVPDDVLRAPLNAGWRRQTCVRCISSSGVRGDVMYYTPCGKRLGSYAEVTRYLTKNKIKNLGRQNFSFSCKAIVGSFLHVKTENGRSVIVQLSEKEINDMISRLQNHQNTRNEVSESGAQSRKPGKSISKSQVGEDKNLHKKRGRPACGGTPVYHVKDFNAAAFSTPSVGHESLPKAAEVKEKRPRGRPSKSFVSQAQAVAQAANAPKETHSNKRSEDHPSHYMNIIHWQEKERARQQTMIQQALEIARQKEERKRLYAERLIREQEKIAAKTAYLQRLKFLRQPMEDLELQDSKKLIDLNKIDNLHMDAGAFADLLMVAEFVDNFGDVLKINKREIPSLSDLHSGLFNEKRAVKKLLRLTKILLTLVLEYPGLPAGPCSKTLLGQSYKDCVVDYDNMGELMRMFLVNRGVEGAQLALLLETHCFEALDAANKTAILAFMCNELLYCRNVVREIENNVDLLNRLKGDKWSLDGKQKQLKSLAANRKNTDKDSGDESDLEKKVSPVIEVAEEDETLFKVRMKVIAESESASTEDAAVEATDANGMGQKVAELNRSIRAVESKIRRLPLGQDRYYRMYWSLPASSNGLLVETLESVCRRPNYSVPVELNRVSRDRTLRREIRQCLYSVVDCVCDTLNQTDFVDQKPLCKVNSKSDLLVYTDRCARHSFDADLAEGWFIVDQAQKLEDLESALNSRGVREKQLIRTLNIRMNETTKQELFTRDCGFVTDKLLFLGRISNGNAVNMAKLRGILKKLRDLEDKVFHSNVSDKSWKPPDLDQEDAESENSDSSDDGGSSSDSSNENSCDSRHKSQRCKNMMCIGSNDCLPQTSDALISLIRRRTINLLANVEKRYLSPSFIDSHEEENLFKNVSANVSECDSESLQQTNDVEYNDRHSSPNNYTQESLSLEKRWRQAIQSAQTPAQLSMCLDMLDSHIAWEKSAMRATCQICRRGDDDSQLLLCDGCDMGYHTYCFRPQLESIPEGDFYCPECVSKATRRPYCLLCCRHTARSMVVCNECQHKFHCDCVATSVHSNKISTCGRAPEPDAKDWLCDGCLSVKNNSNEQRNKNRKKQVARMRDLKSDQCSSVAKKRRNDSENKQRLETNASNSSAIGARTMSKGFKRRQSNESDSNAAKISKPSSPLKCAELCGIILAELDAHKDSWPFKSPVDMNAFPLYKEVIKKPMDFYQIRQNLNADVYKSVDGFLNDVKLIFDNCKTFNEDDSPVGKAGHSLRRFLNKFWKELKEATGTKS